MGADERQRWRAAARNAGAQVTKTARATADFLSRPDGPRVAVFETTGWDTHANQGADSGRAGTATARRWMPACVRCAMRWARPGIAPPCWWPRSSAAPSAVNGTRGTDHGTGAAAFLLGGAVRGGRVIGRWPGLSAAALYQGRDLQPTTDIRSVMKSVLRDHMQVPQRLLEESVFPDSGAAVYLPGLV